jgi:hypothetical protein
VSQSGQLPEDDIAAACGSSNTPDLEGRAKADIEAQANISDYGNQTDSANTTGRFPFKGPAVSMIELWSSTQLNNFLIIATTH